MIRSGLPGAVLGGLLLCGAAHAQVVREQGAVSVAGVLHTSTNPSDDFTFRSAGGEILFADLDADLYLPRGSHDEGGCEEDGGGDGCGGEDDGGRFTFCLTVADAGGDLLCSADPNVRPGWERDPRLACVLEQPGQYVLRVSLCNPPAEDEEVELPYLLNLSLRKRARDGELIQAITTSRNSLPAQR